ncbi:MAG: DNA-directed RNA polymerase subunit beta [Candidatus Cloacimonetes bacterium]|nr:DNA-directed RNA polymerase subunit beta [Candidatus Cloacimonadota bacterium]
MLLKNIKSYSRIRKRIEELGVPEVEVPNLLAIQIDSYENFLQKDVHPKSRKDIGLQAVFNSIFPIEDSKGYFLLEFVEYNVLKEKYTKEECIERNLSYQSPIRVTMKLTKYDDEVLRETGEKIVKEIIESELYLGDIPLITDEGTFIINGAERVIISQLHRSPGAFFTTENHPSGKELISATVIPYKGSWLEFSMDVNDTMYVHIDKRRKLPVSVLLRCIGLSTNDDIRYQFYEIDEINVDESKGRILAYDVIDKETGSAVVERFTKLTDELIVEIKETGVKKIKVVALESDVHHKILDRTIEKDQTENEEEGVKKIYNLIRPGEEPTFETALALVNRMFFDDKRYNLGEVGRYKLNERLEVDVPGDIFILTKEDIIAIINKMIAIYRGRDSTDDIDNLSNRRIRTIGELLEDEYTNGLSRIARIAMEKMSISNPEDVTISELINSMALIGVIQSFFLTGQLSQFMEQTNPLAAITHKRRLSALGPGGLTRERAGFEVRDVHQSHYGRICPIETPEGPNIGLISSPAIYSRVNKLGFLETPYIKVVDGKITDQIDYLDSAQEEKYTIAQADISHIGKDLAIEDEQVFAKKGEEYVLVAPEEVEYMDVAPQQIVSVSAALIPFLEHDDANRALMGSNMQRQAVPLLRPSAPIVGTGVEKIVAQDSGAVAVAPFDGIIERVTSSYIDIKKIDDESENLDLYSESRIYLKKFYRSNQDTCINQNPIVTKGDKVKRGQAISDGPAIEGKRLALGQNLLVAFMPWYGYNYEDAIILSEKVAREDILTSIYIEVLEVSVRQVKNGKEELAYDIPNVPIQALRNLDKSGIVRTGSVIKPGDIIVGKITPKSVDIDPSPEENLMRALFGDRAGNFTDSSLKAKPGMEGVVIDVKVFKKQEDVTDFEDEKKDILHRLKQEHTERKKKIDSFLEINLAKHLVGQVAKNISDVKDNRFFIPTGKKITKNDLQKINFKKLNLDYELVEDDAKNQEIYQAVILRVKNAIEENDNIHKKEKERLKHGDELPYGVNKMVKVFIAKKRKIQVGDKLAGRHGNKGVISKIAPLEDMPFMEDGTPVEVVLNPLGVPSRMNIGQIMETHLGMAARVLGFQVETPVFDGASLKDIQKEMKKANLPEDGKQQLYDGKTGDPFRERVTVGVIYMMKLNHLIEDKIHARSTGPYSLITQQPLGGKAQHGGQRLGEMEVWALEAYGASRILEEMLTTKSDDVDGRTNAFKAITSGLNPSSPGVPESFNVLVSELKSLCFNIEFLTDKELEA